MPPEGTVVAARGVGILGQGTGKVSGRGLAPFTQEFRGLLAA